MTWFSPKQIQQAREVNLIDYCKKQGYDLDGDCRHPHLEDHDSLVFFPENIDRQWHRFSTGEGGDAVNFIEYYEDKSFPEAVATLLSGNYSHERTASFHPEYTTQPSTFHFDQPTTRQFDHAYDYLVNIRKLDKHLINHLHRENYIQQDQRNNVVFKWYDPFSSRKKLVGSSIQGTVKTQGRSYKQIAKNSLSDYGFSFSFGSKIEKYEKVFIFESAIDLLSYLTLHPKGWFGELHNCLFLSMEGLKERPIAHLYHSENSHVKQLFIGTDNDEAGNHFYDNLINQHFRRYPEKCQRISPPLGKDWNDTLIQSQPPSLIKDNTIEKNPHYFEDANTLIDDEELEL